MKKKKALGKNKEPASAAAPRVQYGVVPYRVGEDGHLEVMLVTSRQTRRWVAIAASRSVEWKTCATSWC